MLYADAEWITGCLESAKLLAPPLSTGSDGWDDWTTRHHQDLQLDACVKDATSAPRRYTTHE